MNGPVETVRPPDAILPGQVSTRHPARPEVQAALSQVVVQPSILPGDRPIHEWLLDALTLVLLLDSSRSSDYLPCGCSSSLDYNLQDRNRRSKSFYTRILRPASYQRECDG